MPELIEQMYCSQQIVIPPKFPYILKRYCKAAIKTQPYDLLRWSYEYFKALAQNRPPPVKLRLEYPIYSTEGGLTRGCLKVLAQQLAGMTDIPLQTVRAAWQGFCLDQHELRRVFCLCQVYLREEVVPFLHFIAVAGGLLTKTLTHTMILLCETLTKEPDGGSAAIPVLDFLTMYKFLAWLDASKDVKYYNGYKEGESPPAETIEEEEETAESVADTSMENSSDEFWPDCRDFRELTIIDSSVPRSTRLSLKLNMPVLGKIERSPSIERASQIERDNYMRERKGRPAPSEDVEQKLREMSTSKLTAQSATKEDAPKKEEKVEKKKEGLQIRVLDEDDNEIPYKLYGEPIAVIIEEDLEEETPADVVAQSTMMDEHVKEEEVGREAERIQEFVNECYEDREERREDLERTFEEIAAIVDRFKSANYDLGVVAQINCEEHCISYAGVIDNVLEDLRDICQSTLGLNGMVAGRQMSTTSGEFIVSHIEKEMMDYINEQIAILPDPDLKKKKAKPEEVAMIRDILETFLDENMDIIVPEPEEVEEEEQPIPEITAVYAVPGIGPPVEEEIMREFIDYALDVCKVQADLFMPRNIRHFMCPPLEKFTEYQYDKVDQKEEVPMAGVITD